MKIPPRVNESKLKNLHLDVPMVASAMVAASKHVQENSLEVEVYQRDDFKSIPKSFELEPSGSRFTIPLLIPEEIASGDNRTFMKDALTNRDLPLPLLWQIKTASGHDGSVIVGRIDTIEEVVNGLGNAKGVFDVGVYGREAERLVRGGFLRGVSADLDQFEGSTEEDDEDETEASNKIKSKKISVDAGRVMAATLVAKPAFQECYLLLDTLPSFANGDEIVPDGVYEANLDEMDNELAALAASAAPVIPPKNWFTNPGLGEPTPLTVDDDGRVFGHVAVWNVSHIGLPGAKKPPRSASNYAYFCTGVVRTDDGTDMRVGQLTLAGGHASMMASAEDAVKHYDDTASAVADVTAGEDRHGIWVAGALRPEVSPQQVRALRASAPSGDWRPIGNRLELVAVCQVNVPGFPTVRSMVAGGQLTALVAAGAPELAQIRAESALTPLEERIASLEQQDLAKKHELAMERLSATTKPRQSELEAMAASAEARLTTTKQAEEAKLAMQIEKLAARFNS